MARPLRIQFPGAVYHVMSRGNQGNVIFRDDADRGQFLTTLGEACEKTGWQVHAYVLKGNHYHLLVETPEANLVVGMHWLQGTYTRRFNARHRLTGHVLAGRYKAIVVDTGEEAYFGIVSTYIHLNPVRAGLIRPGEQKLREYAWSSYPSYVDDRQRFAGWLRRDRVWGALGFQAGSASALRGYEAYLESRALECADPRKGRELQNEWRELRKGWYVGSRGFRVQLLEAMERGMEGRMADSVAGEAIDAHGELAAERWLDSAEKTLRWTGRDWANEPGVTPSKQVLAWGLRQWTAVSCRWISERLAMGHASSVSRAVKVVRQSRDKRVREWRELLGKAGRRPRPGADFRD